MRGHAGHRAGLAAYGLLAAAFAGLAWWSWGKWTDPHIDFGNELYVAWRLSEGQVLYRDIASRQGPLPSYVNALWFELFGVSLRTLVWCNLAILAGLCAMLFRIFRAACDLATATGVCLLFLVVFAFSQYGGIANYNYVTPYHHHQTHGIALALAMILAFGRFFGSRRTPWLGLAGICLGACFLTKAELFAPTAAAAACGIALAAPPARALVAFAVGALLPPLATGALLAAAMPPDLALTGVLGNWAYLFGGVFGDSFYRRGAGFHRLGPNALAAVAAFTSLALFAALAAALDCFAPARRRALWAAGAGAFVFLALAGGPLAPPWTQLPRALPLTTLVLGGVLARRAWRDRSDREALARRAPLALFAVLGLGLLTKMLLAARVIHYGFVLAMPATLLLVAALAHGLPRALARRGSTGGGELARAVAIGALAAFALFHWRWSDRIYARKTLRLGSGSDAILADPPRVGPRASVLQRALERLDALAPADATLLAWPEGASLNYWLRRRNPTRYTLFLPVELDAFGSAAVLADLREHAPDFVVLVHRDPGEFGVRAFGADARSGRDVLAWLREHYERVERIGAEPFRSRRFGVAILRRSDASPAVGGSEKGSR